MAEAGWYPDPEEPGLSATSTGRPGRSTSAARSTPSASCAAAGCAACSGAGAAPRATVGRPGPQPWPAPPQPGSGSEPPGPAFATPGPRVGTRTWHRPRLIGLGAVLAVVILVAGYFLFLRGDGKPTLTYGGAKIAYGRRRPRPGRDQPGHDREPAARGQGRPRPLLLRRAETPGGGGQEVRRRRRTCAAARCCSSTATRAGLSHVRPDPHRFRPAGDAEPGGHGPQRGPRRRSGRPQAGAPGRQGVRRAAATA